MARFPSRRIRAKSADVPLAYAPSRASLVLWGDEKSALARALAAVGRERPAEAIVPPGERREVEGVEIPVAAALPVLARTNAASIGDLPASLATWALAGKHAVDLAAREQIVPTVVRGAGGATEARWAAALASADDAARAGALARAMPPASHAIVDGDDAPAPDAALRAFLDASVDALARGGPVGLGAAGAPSAGWEARFVSALRDADPTFAISGFGERTVEGELARWAEGAMGARDRARACFRLELPEEGSETFVLRLLLRAPDDPSLVVDAKEVWAGRAARLGKAFEHADEALLGALATAARLFPPLRAALRERTPTAVPLAVAEAWAFLTSGGPALAQAGFGVIVPAALTKSGERRLRLRMKLDTRAPPPVAGRVEGAAALGIDELVQFEWQAAIGGERVDARELAALAKAKAPLVRHRGAWVAVDPSELAEIERRLARARGEVTRAEALRVALLGVVGEQAGAAPAEVVASGALAAAIARIRASAAPQAEVDARVVPRALRATLRPYQVRGVAWLRTMAELGLGACLADDMGLGKTVQLIAFLLARRELGGARPALVIAPTSVLGNWEREIERFAPDLAIVRHYGAPRAKKAPSLPREAGTVVVTSYGVARRDVALLAAVPWDTVVLDEAQNVKNAASAGARAMRSLRAAQKIALTGTPVENRLAELWSILEIVAPGLLGPLETFRTTYAVPVERWGNRARAEDLRRLTAPFVLRRTKSDPAIVQDLPPKNEANVVCTLTREQATLYKAVVDEELARIADSEGVARRGRVLALLGALKQICNHPAQYLGEKGPLAKRSGKLARVTAMLDEAVAAGDKALVFTQYRQMGDRLVAHLSAELGVEILFLHGGTSKAARDALVRRFQEDRAARVFVLSVKAGGTGLNLTAASHVFHFDRWWNPAVEDQATDRAYRIGQTRAVQVHKLVCAGTVEEKVDRLLAKKREIAASVVGAGERWITELDDAELRALVSLSRDAAAVADEEDA